MFTTWTVAQSHFPPAPLKGLLTEAAVLPSLSMYPNPDPIHLHLANPQAEKIYPP